MATLLLSTVGAAIGATLGPLGAAAGRFVGASLGHTIDQSLFGSQGKVVEGPRLDNLQLMSGSEGQPVPRVYGQARVGTKLIWGRPIEERVTTESASGGGGKGSGNAGRSSQTYKTYHYFCSFALGICEGSLTSIGRIWADGVLLNQSDLTIRYYLGTEDQQPDPLIEADIGLNKTPAFRYLAYLVFEQMPLEPYGNRIPQITVEVFRSLKGFADTIKGVCLIPGSGEFVYDTRRVTHKIAEGRWVSENVHQTSGMTNFIKSMEDLLASCPALDSVSLVVSWFGDDLRWGQCRLRPGVERQIKETNGATWQVAGQLRHEAYKVSQYAGGAAYGGTPSDDSVIRAIQWLKGKGLKVTLYPFIQMDIPDDNLKPDPWGGEHQAAYPWRGRITTEIAPGQADTTDGLSLIQQECDQFFGHSKPESFSPQGLTVTHLGTDQGSYRHFCLHYAHLSLLAGGVDGFLIGSEMVGVTRLRDDKGTYPAVQALTRLAEDVRSIVGSSVDISYAADWTEYGAYRPPETEGYVDFPLDDLWAHPDIDYIGIDYYPPLGDCRWEGDLDAGSGGAHDYNYIRGNIEGGEAYDWYYADQEARLSGDRLPINHWVDRQKDLRSFITRHHYPQRNGEDKSATAWTPGSKAFRFCEFGVGAVDFGINRPSAFFDQKSSTSTLPPFSAGQRDDYGQSVALAAVLDYWRDEEVKARAEGQPVIVEGDKTQIWAWDARPYPTFPERGDVWSDASNWVIGHWLNGRLSAVGLETLVKQLVYDFTGQSLISEGVAGNIAGFVIDRPLSCRGALNQLAAIFDFSIIERGADLVLRKGSPQGVACELSYDDLVTGRDQPLFERSFKDISDKPSQVALQFTRQDGDYKSASVIARKDDRSDLSEASAAPAVVMSVDQARLIAWSWLSRLWRDRESAHFILGYRSLGLEPGDRLRLTLADETSLDVFVRSCEGGLSRAVDADIFIPETGRRVPGSFHIPEGSSDDPGSLGSAAVRVFDMPAADLVSGSGIGHFMAVAADPWPDSFIVYRGIEDGQYTYHSLVLAPSVMGKLDNALPQGQSWRWMWGHEVVVTLVSGSLTSESRIDVLGGANGALIGNASQGYEIVQFQKATLIGENQYRLSGLLRGQGGTEHRAGKGHDIGDDFILIDSNLHNLNLGIDDLDRDIGWRIVPSGVALQDERVAAVNSIPKGEALKSWSPAHPGARRTDEAIELTWIRRARYGGDNWALRDVPDDGLPASYVLEIIHNNEVVSHHEVTGERFAFSREEELSCFGSRQQALHLRIWAIHPQFGSGQICEAVVDVRTV